MLRYRKPHLLCLLVLTIFIALCTGCSHSKKKPSQDIKVPVTTKQVTKSPQPSPIKISFIASKNMNSDSSGHGSPIKIMLYQLSNDSDFNNIISPVNEDIDLVQQHAIESTSIMLQPGKNMPYHLAVSPQAHYLGIIGYFRAPNANQWKLLITVPLLKPTMTVIVSQNSLMLSRQKG